MADYGVITVTTAGTAVQGPSTNPGTYQIVFDPASGGYGFVGLDSSVEQSTGTGYKMTAGAVLIITVEDLADLYFDATVDNSTFHYIRVMGETGAAPHVS